MSALFDKATLGIFETKTPPVLNFGNQTAPIRAAIQGVLQGVYNYAQNKNVNYALEDAFAAFVTSYGVEAVMERVPMINKMLTKPEQMALETVLGSAAYGAYKINAYQAMNRQELYGTDYTTAVFDDVIINGLSNIVLHKIVG